MTLTATLRARAPHLYADQLAHWLVTSPLHGVDDVRFAPADLRGAIVEADFLASVPTVDPVWTSRATVEVWPVRQDGSRGCRAYAADPQLADVVQLARPVVRGQVAA